MRLLRLRLRLLQRLPPLLLRACALLLRPRRRPRRRLKLQLRLQPGLLGPPALFVLGPVCLAVGGLATSIIKTQDSQISVSLI
jgi:hypothetical protein